MYVRLCALMFLYMSAEVHIHVYIYRYIHAPKNASPQHTHPQQGECGTCAIVAIIGFA